MAEVAPSAGGGGGNRNFLLIIGGLAALLFIGLLALGAVLILPGLFGGEQVAAGPTLTPTRIVIPPTATRTPPPTATLVVEKRPTPVLGPGERAVLIEVGDDQNVTLTTYEGGKAPLVQLGTWAFDAGSNQLTLTFTQLNGKPFKDEIVLKLVGGELSVVSFNRALHGNLSNIELKRSSGNPSNQLLPRQGRTLGLGMPALQASATPQPLPGEYTGSIPAPAEGERLVVLVLTADGSAVLSTQDGGANSVLQLGTWQAEGNDVTVKLIERDGSSFEDTLVFELKNGDLVGTTFDQALHGAILELKRDPASPVSADFPATGSYSMTISLLATATPIPITATPIPITATPTADTDQLPDSGMGEDLLLLFGGGLLLLGVIVVVRRMRSA